MSKKTSWWLNQPTCKKSHSFSKGQSENKPYLKPPPKRVCLFCFDCCVCFFLKDGLISRVSKFQEKQADTLLCGCMYVTCIHPSTDAFWKDIPNCWLYMVFLSYPSWKYTTIKKTCNVGYAVKFGREGRMLDVSAKICSAMAIRLVEEILNPLIVSLSHYLQGLIHARWLAGLLPQQYFCFFLPSFTSGVVFHPQFFFIVLTSKNSTKMWAVSLPSWSFRGFRQLQVAPPTSLEVISQHSQLPILKTMHFQHRSLWGLGMLRYQASLHHSLNADCGLQMNICKNLCWLLTNHILKNRTNVKCIETNFCKPLLLMPLPQQKKLI